MNVLPISNLIFAILNVLLVIYIFWYLIVRYFIPGLRSGLKAHEQQLVHEQQAYDKTLLEYEAIKRQRSVYDIQAQQLLILIDRWNKVIEQEKQQATIEQHMRSTIIREYMQRRQEYHHLRRIQDYVFERAYQTAHIELQKKYASQAEGKQHIHAIIQALEGNSHG
jgi:hypothetical protein